MNLNDCIDRQLAFTTKRGLLMPGFEPTSSSLYGQVHYHHAIRRNQKTEIYDITTKGHKQTIFQLVQKHSTLVQGHM